MPTVSGTAPARIRYVPAVGPRLRWLLFALFGLFAAWAERHCPGRLVHVLEGGYAPDGVLAGVGAALAATTGRTGSEELAEAPGEDAEARVRMLRGLLADRWACLR